MSDEHKWWLTLTLSHGDWNFVCETPVSNSPGCPSLGASTNDFHAVSEDSGWYFVQTELPPFRPEKEKKSDSDKRNHAPRSIPKQGRICAKLSYSKGTGSEKVQVFEVPPTDFDISVKPNTKWIFHLDKQNDVASFLVKDGKIQGCRLFVSEGTVSLLTYDCFRCVAN